MGNGWKVFEIHNSIVIDGEHFDGNQGSCHFYLTFSAGLKITLG